MIMCRPGSIFSYRISGNLAEGIIVAFHVKISATANEFQNLFSVRDALTDYVSLTTYYDSTDGFIRVRLQNPTWNVVLTSSASISQSIY